jgi:hypothetical protein
VHGAGRRADAAQLGEGDQGFEEARVRGVKNTLSITGMEQKRA